MHGRCPCRSPTAKAASGHAGAPLRGLPVRPCAALSWAAAPWHRPHAPTPVYARAMSTDTRAETQRLGVETTGIEIIDEAARTA